MSVAAAPSLVADLLAAPRPEGWEALRAQAEARVARLGLPTTRQEDWKYLDLSALSEQSFRPAPPVEADIRERILPEARGGRLVFVNGHPDPHHSCVSGLPAGVRLMPLSQASEAASALGTVLDAVTMDVFAALNTARFTDGAFIFVPRGVKVESPLHLLFITQEKDGPALALPRVLIVMERGAELELIEEHVGAGAYLSAPVVEVKLGENAQLRHERVQRQSEEAFHLGSLAADLARDARYLSRTISFGGRISRETPHARLATGSELALDGLALLDGQQVADTHSAILHAAPNAQSRQLHKAIVDGSARAIFNGRILVAPFASGTDAQQQSRNLLLSDRARVDTKPQLEIENDDVKCAHGAAIGQLDPDELFYLQSRGLDLAAARNLLTYGFASDLIGRIPVASLRRSLRQQVLARTHAALGELA
ncbi:MAG TPA: Fe-S cluster assembly protein SufD [Holophagaceae bacterium]|nr:Fe-S cluster assembly protein SufD [Holophagaceae bacterium]